MHEKDVNTEVSKKQTVKQESVAGSRQERSKDHGETPNQSNPSQDVNAEFVGAYAFMDATRVQKGGAK